MAHAQAGRSFLRYPLRNDPGMEQLGISNGMDGMIPKRDLHHLLPCQPLLPSFLTSCLLVRRFQFKYIFKMSSLLEVDSSLTLSDSASTSTALHSKKTAPVQAHSRALIEDKDPALFYCIHCKLDSVPLPYGTGLARNLTKHIKRHHKSVILPKTQSKNQEAMNQQIKQLYYEAQASKDTKEFNIKVLKSYLNLVVIA